MTILGIDPAVLDAASVAFQHGAPLQTVRHALADRRAGPLGAAPRHYGSSCKATQLGGHERPEGIG
jgi:hypothetical protein